MKKLIFLLSAAVMAAVCSVSAMAAEVVVLSGNSQPDEAVSIPIQDKKASDDEWMNLTYRGGLSAYRKLTGEKIAVVSSVDAPPGDPVVITGYVVGTPYVPASKPKETPVPSPTPEPAKPSPTPSPTPVPEEQAPASETNVELSSAEIAEITASVGSMLKFATSTREDSKAAEYVLPAQKDAATTYFNKRNADILQLDDKSTTKTGIQAVKTLMPKLVKAEKAKVSEIHVVSADEVVVSVGVPVFSTYATLEEEFVKQLPKDLDVTKMGSIGEILSDPLAAKSTVDATMYETAMQFFDKFGTLVQDIDLYTEKPGLFEEGKMEITFMKIDDSWKIDAATAMIRVKIDGVDAQIKLIQI